METRGTREGRILIVEDDFDLAEITKINLGRSGYESDNAYTCRQAEKLLEENRYDCILMDAMLPDGEGINLCGVIRERHTTPVIFMSCLDDCATIISALGAGGDDYVVKPVNFDILIARIEAKIRRSKTLNDAVDFKNNEDRSLKRFNSFVIDTLRRRALRRQGNEDKEIMLSAIEYSLLLYMSERPETLLLYNDLYSAVWNGESYGDIRTVMVHISNLRKKIDPDGLGIIETVRGAGYIFCDAR